MKIFFFKIVAVFLIAATEILGQTADISCVSCSSIIFQDASFTNLELFRDLDCEHGIGLTDICPIGYVCASIIGVETQNITDYGVTNFHIVIRGCEESTAFDTTQAASGCLPADQHHDFLAIDGDPDVQFLRFDGEICYCSENVCNDEMAPSIHRPALPHTPPPNAPGLQCRYCIHTEYHDEFLNDPTTTNFDCEDGQLASEDVHYITCPEGSVCLNLRGQTTYSAGGYDYTADVHERRCFFVDDTMDAESGCVDPDVIGDYQADYYSYFDDVIFQGGACYCSSDLCDCDPEVCLESTPRLQCRYCFHTEFHDDTLNDPTAINFDCEDGQLASEDVHNITCPKGSVCLNLRGQTTYSAGGYDYTADVHERSCFVVDDTMDAESGCVDPDVIGDYQADYYSYLDDVIFQGGACYCSSDLCDCDPEVCLESTVFTCADHDFCSGVHEMCVDGFLRPRCECEDGFGFDEHFQCQKVAVACITCSSRHFLGDYTSGTVSEDLDCEAGIGLSYSCADDSVCVTLVGTETNLHDGYGPVQSKVVHRGCERRTFFDEFSSCLSDPQSGNVFNYESSEFPRVNFTGEACYCSENNCNSQLKEIERTIRPIYPDGDARGLQCIVCLSRHSLSSTEASSSSLDSACVDGDLTNPNVYYVTCPFDHSCLKLLGVLRFFVGAAFEEYLVVDRRCIPNTHTMDGDSGCLATDELRDNLEEDYSSYYFYFDLVEIEAPACYCSTDFCDCNVTACKTDISEGETCESAGVCAKSHEDCHDTTTAGPVCFCEEGYSYNVIRDCELDEQQTCDSEGVCSNPNEDCRNTEFGPECICDLGYERDSEGDCQMTEQQTCESEGVCSNPNEDCRNTEFGPECICDLGYEKNSEGDCEMIVLTCDSEGVCDQPNEVCHDMENGPMCFCEDGYEKNDEGDCVLTTPTCLDGNLCTQPNEHCEDIANTPTCACDTGYEYDTTGTCVQGLTCRTKECTLANSECVDSQDGPRCLCKQNYEMGPDENRCNLIPNANQNANQNGGGSNGNRNSQLNQMMFWILAVTGVILTRQ